MTTTLIVRDATLAINGAPEKRSQPRAHLNARIAEVANLDARTAEECVEVLTSVAKGEGAEPEVLEALVIVALAHPALAQNLGLDPVAIGRRLVARLERLSEIERALAVLEVLLHHAPGNEALESHLAQLMRRQGMVKDLVGRYFERAKKLVREGRNQEAAGWLREVLQLDPGRKDAARLIRDLRFRNQNHAQRRGVGVRFVLGTLALGLFAAYAALREFRLSTEFNNLSPAATGNLASQKRRLSDLEQFIQAHPVWHGALGVLSERSELRVQIEVFEERLRQEREAVERAERERLESADLSRARGMLAIEQADLQGALEAFRQALEFGGPDWKHYERVSGDVSELEAHLRANR